LTSVANFFIFYFIFFYRTTFSDIEEVKSHFPPRPFDPRNKIRFFEATTFRFWGTPTTPNRHRARAFWCLSMLKNIIKWFDSSKKLLTYPFLTDTKMHVYMLDSSLIVLPDKP